MLRKTRAVFIAFIGVVTFEILISNGFRLSTTSVGKILPSTNEPINIQVSQIERETRIHFLSSSLVVLATNNAYGRGAEISPECNKDETNLSDSFPNGVIPKFTATVIEQAKFKSLRQEESISKIPFAVGMSLLLRGMVRPMDVALVASWTAYFTILNMTARSARDTGAPVLPALPMQGHTPEIVSNPLGSRFSSSSNYRRWLKLGVFVGLLGPLAWLMAITFVRPLQGTLTELQQARVVSRPMFLLCCQMITEAISKRNPTPLPLRILIPIVYNATRLAYLWQWAFNTTNLSLGLIGRGLGIINIAYCAINLFAFLIPIASIRYMRAHFFGVEAKEVMTTVGLEDTVGIVPNNI